MNQFKNIVASMWILFILSGCLYGQCMNGPCALERERLIRNIKPYGAHWIKEGMTKEQRREDFKSCGGSEDMRQGYEAQPNQSAQDFFEAFNAHVTQVAACMRRADYVYLEECDVRCLHP